MVSFDVVIFHGQQMLSFLCYHFPLYIFCVIIYVIIWCYHLLLSFPPFFLFPENVTHSYIISDPDPKRPGSEINFFTYSIFNNFLK